MGLPGLAASAVGYTRAGVQQAVDATAGRANRELTSPWRLVQHDPRPLVLSQPARPVMPSGAVRALPSVAMVTPSLNQVDHLEQAMRSVLDQGYPGLSYVVRDGGSTDGSAEVVERFRSRLAHAGSAPDGGQADAINLGFAHATGDVMGWLNSDDLLLPGALRAVGAYFAAHPGVDVVYGDRIVIDEIGREVGRWRLPDDTHAFLAWADYIPQETLFWRRSLWERVGGRLDASMAFAIDWDLLLRFVDAGAVFARIPAFLGAFRVHASSKTSGQLASTGRDEMAMLRRRALGHDPAEADIHRALRPLHVRAWALAQRGRLDAVLGRRR